MMKSKVSWYAKSGTEPQRIVASYLYDDSVHVMSSFEMNKKASLTFSETVCGDIFSMIEDVLANPSDCSILALHKTLVLTKHLLVFGHERVLELVNQRVRFLAGSLTTYNTALHSSSTTISSLKGGKVDTAGPVREVATQLIELLSSPERIRILREKSADPNSLVPVGRKDDVAYESTEHRLKVESGQYVPDAKKSNLANSGAGYGSGLAMRDASGKVVVGASHSIEEMMAAASKEKPSFFDDPNDPRNKKQQQRQEDNKHLDSDYTRQAMAPDLLDLDFHGAVTRSKPVVSDPFSEENLSAAKREEELRKELEKQRQELEKLKGKVVSPESDGNKAADGGELQDSPLTLGSIGQQIDADPKVMGGPGLGSASAISSMDNLAPVQNTSPFPMGQSLSVQTTSATAYSSMGNAPPAAAPTLETSCSSEMQQVHQQWGGVMGGSTTATSRSLYSGEPEEGIGNMPAPPPMAPPPPPPQDDQSSVSSTSASQGMGGMPGSQQQMMPMMMQNPMMMPQMQQPGGMTPQMQQPSGMTPQMQQPSGMTPQMQQASGMTPQMQQASGMTPQMQQAGMTPQMQQAGMTPQQQQQMMMMNPQQMMMPQQQMMMMNPQQQQMMMMSGQPMMMPMMMGTMGPMSMMNPQQQQMMMMNQQNQQQQQPNNPQAMNQQQQMMGYPQYNAMWNQNQSQNQASMY